MVEITCLSHNFSGILSGRNNGEIILNGFSNFKRDFISFKYHKTCQSLISYNRDFNKFLSCHNKDLLHWDIRNPSKPFHIFKTTLSDDIGAVALSDFDEFISLGDDDGNMMLIKNDSNNITLNKIHDNIITAIVFYNSDFLKTYSSGMDSKIVSRSTEGNDDNFEFNLCSLIDEESEYEYSEFVSLSPALINDMIIFKDNLFCGVENCGIEMFSFDNNFIAYENTFYNHSLGVSCLSNTKDHLVSAGNDCKITFWSLDSQLNLDVVVSTYNDEKFNALVCFDETSVCFADIDNRIGHVRLLETGITNINFL